MSFCLFLDESGHDHKNAPYEVRGGIALHAGKIWPFVQALKNAESACFGDFLHRYRTEIKGHKLLDKHRFEWGSQDDILDDVARRKHSLAFLNKGIEHKSPTRVEFSAYGQACLLMADRLFDLLRYHGAILFAAAIPRSAIKPETVAASEFLRKDQVFLLERYFYFLENVQEFGLIVMDETDRNQDRQFVKRLERYFTASQTGKYRTARIVPSPFFVSSDMAYPVQAADVCIYCINHAFRLPGQGMDAPIRTEIQFRYGSYLKDLEFHGDGYRDGSVFRVHGIAYVPNPYGSGHA